MIYTVEYIRRHAVNNTTEFNGKWYPKRPLRCSSLRERLRFAWMVLTKKADALLWAEDIFKDYEDQ